MGGAILQTRRFRSGPIDIEILRTAILLSAHQSRHHVGAADPLPVGVPVNIGVANAEGAATNFARRDHVHDHPAGLGFDLHHNHYLRMIGDLFAGGPGFVAADWGETMGDDTIMLMPLQVPYTITVDRIGLIPRVQNGNIEVGIYADNGDTPVGGARLVTSGIVACPAAGQKQEITIADYELTAELYWLALWRSSATVVFAMSGAALAASFLGGTLYTHAIWAGGGGLPDTCPATEDTGASDAMYVRVKSVP